MPPHSSSTARASRARIAGSCLVELAAAEFDAAVPEFIKELSLP